ITGALKGSPTSNVSSFSALSSPDIILPYSETKLRACAWPREFPIPRFPYNVEVQLQRGNESFRETGTRLKVTPGLKSDILEKYVEEIFQRKEVVKESPGAGELQARWPAFLSIDEINAEFQHITTVPLETTFMEQLDCHLPQLTSVFQKKG
ncbi:hypothetical protein Z043_125624, partial [Scleropages formosus]